MIDKQLEDDLREAIRLIHVAHGLLARAGVGQDAYFLVRNEVKEAKAHLWQAERSASMSLGLLLTHGS